MCAACCVASRCVASRRILLCVTRLFLASPKKVSEDELQWHLDSSGDVCVGVWPALANGHGCSGLFFSGVILRGRGGFVALRHPEFSCWKSASQMRAFCPTKSAALQA